jgi:hypothetical protein
VENSPHPIGIDLFNSLLSLVGVDDFRSLIWVGLGGCVCTGVALWKWGGAFTMAGFLCNGRRRIRDPARARVSSISRATRGGKVCRSRSSSRSAVCFRAACRAACCCAVGAARFFERDETAWRLPRWGECCSTQAFQSFTFTRFLFLSIVLASVVHRDPDVRWSLATIVGAEFVPATLLVLVTGFFKGSSISVETRWMQDDENFFVFWFVNFGFLPVFVGALVWKHFRDPDHRWERTLTFTALGVFLLCCL